MRTIAWKTLTAGVIMSAVTLSALAQPPEREGRGKGQDAPPKRGGNASKKGGAQGKGQMQGRGGMPMFKVGAVIPPFMIGQLDLSDKQQAEIDKLEASVAKQLKEILNEEQYEMLSRPPQMGPGGPGGPGGRGFGPGGPGGRGFGPGGPGGPGGEEGAPPAKGARGKGEGRRKPAPPPEDQ